MALFTKAVDIWSLSDDEIARLQPGQYVTAGPEGPKAHEKKLGKKYGSILPVAVGFAISSTGNCRASKDDSVDESLSLAFGWKIIRQIREEAIK